MRESGMIEVYVHSLSCLLVLVMCVYMVEICVVESRGLR